MSGTFVIGGAASRAVGATTSTPDTVTGFAAAADLEAGQLELGTGSYYVETREAEGLGWQFRLVDSDGAAVRIKNTATGSFSSEWRNIPTGGGEIDTGRGLKITLGDGGQPYQARDKDHGAASVAYTAKGASIEVDAADSLLDIVYSINKAVYADGNGISATIVDNQLVLSAKRAGDGRLIAASDQTGTVLTSWACCPGGS